MEYLNRTAVQNSSIKPLKILQFGGGNFLRAFVNHSIQKINQQTDFNAGVAIVKPTERGDYKALKNQDGLFSVELEGIQNGEFIQELSIVDCVQTIVNPYKEWETYLQLAKEPDMRFVISNTTEAGIKFNVKDQLDAQPPKEFPAKLTLWLWKRYQHFNGAQDKGCIFLPCELVEDNGITLRKTILQYAAHWNLKAGFSHWINNACHFYNTLVDRIVSGYPKNKIEAIEKELGYKDQLAVHGELYLSWLIQGPDLLSKEFPFDKTDLNIALVPNLGPYRNLKVRVLNGAHTSLVPIGYLLGHRLVKEVMQDQTLATFVSNLLQKEVAPTLELPENYVSNFIADVLDRFKNPALQHQLISIALNSTSKFGTRLLPTLLDYQMNTGYLPKRIVLALAALLRLYKGIDLNNENIPLNDTKTTLDFFIQEWAAFKEHQDFTLLTKNLLQETAIWGQNLDAIPQLTALTSSYVKAISQNQLASVLEELSTDNQPVKS
ncbi:tagaturonate reductase [Croceivirga sp. JEA036]|uniref:tagaturonate reductase n=1 Tax=Croceivirga sp. JEA036 TaxID=2721162 RepID=UPI001438846C|nr:tagaturonate reductase [Croceivirga sp. JEA036]NJB35187.1 tagaturonate reductase [Croceivirga sp. JEA036]